MCKISDYPGLYSKVNEVLRIENLKEDMPGYEFLRRAVVIYKVDGEMDKDVFLSGIKEGMLIPANKDLNFAKKEDRDEVEQWMIEAVKSAVIDVPLMDYIKQLAAEI